MTWAAAIVVVVVVVVVVSILVAIPGGTRRIEASKLSS